MPTPTEADRFNTLSPGTLPGHLGLRIVDMSPGTVKAELDVRDFHMAPNGYLHAGTLITLADTACGYGCLASLPDGAQGFTTIEIKSNHLSTAREGAIDCVATAAHLGRTTQVWDAVLVHRQSGKTLALFRCTQMVLYPKS